MKDSQQTKLPNSLYGKVARFEAKRALDLESEADNGDPREALARALSKSGIGHSKASTIALDVGSSNTIDDTYLEELGISKKRMQDVVYREVIRFNLRSLLA